MGKSVLVAVVFLLYFLICAKNWGYTTKLGKKMGVALHCQLQTG